MNACSSTMVQRAWCGEGERLSNVVGGKLRYRPVRIRVDNPQGAADRAQGRGKRCHFGSTRLWVVMIGDTRGTPLLELSKPPARVWAPHSICGLGGELGRGGLAMLRADILDACFGRGVGWGLGYSRF